MITPACIRIGILTTLIVGKLAASSPAAQAQQLSCDEMPFLGLFGLTCRQMLTTTVNEVIRLENSQSALEDRYDKRCRAGQKRTKTQKSVCKTLKRKIGALQKYSIPLVRDSILPNQMRTCRCDEVTDPVLFQLTAIK